MKKYLTAAAALLMTLNACTTANGGETDGNKEYNVKDIPDGHYDLNDVTAVYPQNGTLYVLGESVGCYNFNEGMVYTLISECEADAVYTDESGVYLLCENQVTLLSDSGEFLAEYAVDYEPETDMDPVFAVNGKRILLAYNRQNGEKDETFGIEITIPVCTEINTVNGNLREIQLPDSAALSGISGIYPNKEGFLLCTRYRYGGLQETCVVIEYDENAEIIAERQADTYSAPENMFYTLSAWQSDLYITKWAPDSEESRVCLSVNLEEHITGVAETAGIDREFEYIPGELFCTGQDYLIWDPVTQVLSVYGKSARTEENTLTVLYSSDQGTDEARYLAARADFSIDIVTYDADRFADILRMKLLAGETDFDVVYMSEAGAALTPSILSYNLFLPLEKYETVTSNLNLCFDGVTDLITWNGHLYGIPQRVTAFAVEVSEKYSETGLPAIADTWNQEDFWKICETAADKLRGNQVITRSNVIWQILLIPIIEDGVRVGRIDSKAVRSLMENLKAYTDIGVMSTKGVGYEILLDPLNIPADPRFTPGVSENSTIVPPPLYSGQKYGSVKGYVFVNRLTEKPESAVRYLEMITSPDNLRLVTNDRSLMLKDSDGYYTRNWGGKHTEGEKNVFQDKNYVLSAENRKINEYAVSAMAGIHPSLYAMDEKFTDTAQDIIGRMLNGEITPQSAADEIVREAEYRFME